MTDYKDYPMSQTKKCKECRGTLSTEHFKSDMRSTDDLASTCTSCLDDRESRVGENPAMYEALFIKQKFRCAICNRKVHLCKILVDHDPQTDETLGLLCRNCNRLLRLSGRGVRVLTAAAGYLGSPKAEGPEKASELEPVRTSPPPPIINL